VLEDTDTTDIVSTGDEDGCAVVEFEDSINFVGDEVQLLKTNKRVIIALLDGPSYIKYNLFWQSDQQKHRTRLTLTESYWLMSGWG
jgi:hypothetical protein